MIFLPPTDRMAKRHNRMPLVLPEDAWRSWLDPAMGDPAPRSAMLAPYPADPRIARPVSKAVSRVGNEEPARIEQAAA